MLTPSAASVASGDSAALDPRVERCRQAVDLLLDCGMKLARALDPERGPPLVRDPVLAYCRLSRALRLTVLLETRLAALAEGGVRVAERGFALAAEAAVQDAGEAEPTDAQDTGGEGAAHRAETCQAGERVGVQRDREAPDEIERFFNRPLTELAAAICCDLGLSAAEALEIQAAFADLTANDDLPQPVKRARAAAFSNRAEAGREGGAHGKRSRPPDGPPPA